VFSGSKQIMREYRQQWSAPMNSFALEGVKRRALSHTYACTWPRDASLGLNDMGVEPDYGRAMIRAKDKEGHRAGEARRRKRQFGSGEKENESIGKTKGETIRASRDARRRRECEVS